MYSVDWTDSPEKNGLDPLGMQATCVRLYQSLVPGISNVTIRLRYYAFYALVAREYGKRVGIARVKEWQSFLRRSEALLALIASREGNVIGVAGTIWASEVLRDHLDHDLITFRDSADRGPGERQYLRQAFGAYGAAYGSQLTVMGVLVESPEHGLPVPTEDIGEALADLYLQAVGDVSKEYFDIVEKGVVRPIDLDDLIGLLPNRIINDSEECRSLQKLLMARLRPNGSVNPRANTIRCLLHYARNSEPQSIGATGFRWAAYEASLQGTAFDGGPSNDPETLWKWATYHAADLLHVAYETMLRAVLETLRDAPGGRSAATVASIVAERLITEATDANADWKTFADTCSAISVSELQNLVGDCTSVGGGEAARLEWTTAYFALQLVGFLYAMHSHEIERLSDLFAAEGTAGQTIATELLWLAGRQDQPLQHVVTELIQQKVIDRHIWVAMRKLNFQRDYTFLFEVDDGLMRFRKMDGPVFTNPRLNTTFTFLRDAKLLDENGPTEAAEQYLAPS